MLQDESLSELSKLTYMLAQAALSSKFPESRTEMVAPEKIKSGKAELKKAIQSLADSNPLLMLVNPLKYVFVPYEIEARRESASFAMKLCLEEMSAIHGNDLHNTKRINLLTKAISVLQNEFYLNTLMGQNPIGHGSLDIEKKLKGEALKIRSFTALLLRSSFRHERLVSIVGKCLNIWRRLVNKV